MKNRAAIKDATKLIDNWLEHQFFFNELTGLGVGIIHGKDIVYEKYLGVQDINSKRKLTKDSLFCVASHSKTFTASAIMKLVEQKRLRLDDLVRDYLSWFSGKGTSAITIRHLLMHCAGMKREGDSNFWNDHKFPSWSEVKEWAKDDPTVYSQLEKFKYSNFGFSILGAVIEAVSGLSYEEYMRKEVIKPMRLSSIYPDIGLAPKSRLCMGHSYRVPGKKRKVYVPPEARAMSAATGFCSDIRSLLKYASHNYGKHPFLKSLSVKEMHRLQWQRPSGDDNWGLGWELFKAGDVEVIGHTGGYPGFVSCTIFSKELELGVVMASNCKHFFPAIGAINLMKSLKVIIDKYKSGNKSFKQFECTVNSSWGRESFVQVGGSLFSYSPMMFDPTSEFFELKHLKGSEFLQLGDDFGNIGEKVVFSKSSVKSGPLVFKKLKKIDELV